MQARRLLLLIFAAAICVAGLLLVFSLSGGDRPGANTGRVQINEIMTSNKGAVPDETGDFPDWIELFNPTNSAIDITGYGLTDNIASMAEWVFPSGSRIEAGGYLVVFCSGDINKGPRHASFKLSAADALVLSDVRGKEVDSIQLMPIAQNATLGRDEAGNWAEMAQPSPGFSNTTEGIAAYKASIQQTVEDNGVRINEFMATNATTLPGPHGDYPDWIELFNTTDADVDISGCGLSDDADRPMKYVLPEGALVPANGVLVIYCSGREGFIDGTLHAPFALRAYTEDVCLAGRNGAVIDSFSYTNQQTDISMARMPDGIGEFVSSAQPTPGFLNTEEGFIEFSRLNAFPRGGLFISEAMANNAGSYTADGGDTPDWIELYNGTGASVSLSGYALSDNPKNPAKWVFPDVTIGDGEYMVVHAAGGDVKDTQKKNLDTNFSLSSGGDILLLYGPDAALLDRLNIKNTVGDISVGRTDGRLSYYDTPTPGSKNASGYAGITATPLFSLMPGIYDAPAELVIEAENGAAIYYTTDCSTPSGASTPYTGPIRLEKNTVVRAVAVQEGCLTGASRTGTYLFSGDNVNHQLPVATLVFDPDDLWNETTGIYVNGPDYDPDVENAFTTANYFKKGDEWERSCAFSIFDDAGTEVFNQNISGRIAGSWGRRREQKGFNLMARSSEGDNRMEYPFFEEREFTDYKSLVLRAGAQDQTMSKIRDELATGLLEGTDVNILHQAYKPYVLYLNGEYWGVYFLKEKRNRFFVAQHEGLESATDIDLIKSVKYVSYGSSEGWAKLMSYVSANDLSKKEAYDYVAAQVDIDSFIDYMICEMYVANSDYGNIQYYQTQDGKWKWIYYDFCWSLGNSGSDADGTKGAKHPTVAMRRKTTNPCSDLLNALMKNPDWCDMFLKRFAELMRSVYSPERVNAHIDSLYTAVAPEIERERQKFNGSDADSANRASYEGFEKSVASIRAFASERPALIKDMLKKEFGLSDSYMQEVFG